MMGNLRIILPFIILPKQQTAEGLTQKRKESEAGGGLRKTRKAETLASGPGTRCLNSFRVFRVFRGDDGCYERRVAAGAVGGPGCLPSRVTGFGGAWDAIGWRKGAASGGLATFHTPFLANATAVVITP